MIILFKLHPVNACSANRNRMTITGRQEVVNGCSKRKFKTGNDPGNKNFNPFAIFVAGTPFISFIGQQKQLPKKTAGVRN